MYINTVHFFSKPWGGGAENNPMRSLVSDQYYFYAKYDKNASTSIGVLRGGQGGLAPPPKIDYRCSKLEVADQQGVVNSRSSINKVYDDRVSN